jgi:flavin-dependent dehydrogenase
VSVEIRPAHGVDALYAPRRTLLDRLLVEAAQTAGATVLFGITVVGLDTHPSGQVTGVFVRDRSGAVRREAAGLVIGADGRGSLVAAAVKATATRRGQHSAGYLYGYMQGMPTTGYEWCYGRGTSAGAIPTNDGLTCLFVAAASAHLDASVAELGVSPAFQTIADTTALGERCRGATLSGNVRYVRGLPSYLRRSSGPGWALVGDAGYWKDPLSTHGMSDAFRDAELLARAVVAAPAPGPEQRRSLAVYEQQRDARAIPMLSVIERLASFEWGLDEVRHLLFELASVMSGDLELLAGLEPQA